MTLKPSARQNSPSPSKKVDIDRPVTNDGTRILFLWFRILGIYMPPKYKFLYIIYSVFVNFLSLIILPFSFSISYLTDPENRELVRFFTTFQVSLNVHACATKFIIIAFLRRHLFKIEAILEKLDARISNSEEIDEIRRTIKFGNRTVIIFFMWYFAYSTSAFLGSIYNGRPPYSLYIPFLNWRDSRRKFAIVSGIEYFLVSVACFQEVSNDAYAVIYIRMLHSHLKTLIMRVGRLGRDPKCTRKDNLKELLLCIKDHKNIIDLNNAVAPVISPTVFVQFMVSAAEIGTALISIVISNDRSPVIGSCLHIGLIISEILPICYFVNCLVAEGERLPQAIFHMNWADQTLEFRRLCLFFMHRSQETMIFFAGKIFPITLNSFVGIVKFSFSLYTLLGTMDFGQQFN